MSAEITRSIAVTRADARLGVLDVHILLSPIDHDPEDWTPVTLTAMIRPDWKVHAEIWMNPISIDVGLVRNEPSWVVATLDVGDMIDVLSPVAVELILWHGARVMTTQHLMV